MKQILILYPYPFFYNFYNQLIMEKDQEIQQQQSESQQLSNQHQDQKNLNQQCDVQEDQAGQGLVPGQNKPQSKISKKQIKKQLKKQKWEQTKLIKRKEKKEKQKEKKKIKKQLEKIENKQNQNEVEVAENIIFMKKRKQDYRQNMKDGLKVVIDLQFFDLMNEKELNSLVKQLAYCHAVNRKVQKPFNYILTSISEQRKEFIDTKYNGNKWGITMLQKSVHEQFDINKLVYLTGDAQETIESFDEEMIYIIGGIVDHNRLKKITYNYANQHKIITRKLPFDGIKLKTNVHLAVNHVWEWMLKNYNGSTWKQALQSVLPSRKICKEDQKQHDQL